MLPEDMYVLSSHGSVLSTSSPKPYPNKLPKCTDCASLFIKAYQMRNAGAVIHSHGMESCIPTLIHPSAKEFRITHMEMIKGIQGHGYHDELVVPIIENTAHERELTESLSEVINAYPKATAVLVRNHGVYIWGDSWISAKTQAECYHYLFDAAIRLNQLGLDWSTSSHGPIHPVKRMDGVVKCCILLDIEGTTTPISFVTDVLFPYARHNLRKHLTSTYDTEETQEDIKLLRAQVDEDLKQGLSSVPIPPADSGKEDVITTLVANVEEMIKADRKVTSLKQLQVYIYSSGSREAQRLIFGHSNYGDLRRYLYGFFDTTIGHKRESRSYFEISQSLGVDKPSEILFLTDVYQEAVAAKTAGVEAIITVRPGNGPLPENHGFKTVQSFLEI